jgi:hypothetical protein
MNAQKTSVILLLVADSQQKLRVPIVMLAQ